MDDKCKGVPPLTPKSTMRQGLDRWTKADTGGDHYDRARGQYSKNTEKKETDHDMVDL